MSERRRHSKIGEFAAEELDRLVEDERSVLGAILVHDEAYDLAVSVIGPTDFYRDAHRLVFESMAALRGRGQAIDFLTLKQELSTSGELDAVGGPKYIASLSDGVPRATNVGLYARIVKAHSERRSFAAALRSQLERVSSGRATPASLASDLADIAAKARGSADRIGGLVQSRGPLITFLDTVTPEAVDWIWHGRLARGKYSLLAGEPGMGKTFLMLDVAARISRGGTWPDGGRAPLGRVLYMTAEDGLADTLRPRVDALGGDPSQIAVLEAVREVDGTRSAITLLRDLDMIAAALREVQPVLIVIDPVTAYLGRVDAHRDNEVRGALAPLIDRIAQDRCALAFIGHLSKDQQRAALHRPGGSVAFVAMARLVLALAADPNDPKRRLLAPLKSNICAPAATLAYRLSETGGLSWESSAVTDVDVEAMFRPTASGEREDRNDAEAVVRELLSNPTIWPLDAKDARATGDAHGVHERTLRRAAKRIGIRIERLGFGPSGKWVWHAPHTADTAIPDTASRTPNVSPMSPLADHTTFRSNNNIEDTETPFPRARAKRNGEPNGRQGQQEAEDGPATF